MVVSRETSPWVSDGGIGPDIPDIRWHQACRALVILLALVDQADCDLRH